MNRNKIAKILAANETIQREMMEQRLRHKQQQLSTEPPINQFWAEDEELKQQIMSEHDIEKCAATLVRIRENRGKVKMKFSRR